MRITKRQLRRIIREAVPHESQAFLEDHPDFQRGYDDAVSGNSPMAGATPEYQSGWEDGFEEQGEPLYGDAGDDYYAAARTPEAVEALKAADFSSNGDIFDDSQGLGVFNHGMYTPQDQKELEDQIQATIEINAALMDAVAALDTGEMQNGSQAYWDIILPVQRKWSKRGASDTEGRESAGEWLEDQGYNWED